MCAGCACPDAGTLREVFDLAELILQSPLDISRPLWTATLVEGLADGKAATLLHVSHAVTDGVGGVEMFAEIYDLERDPPARPTPPAAHPAGSVAQRPDARRASTTCPWPYVGGALGALSGAVSAAGRAVLEPASTVSGIVGYALSGMRVINRAAEPSPLLRRRSLATRTEAIDIPLSDLHKAAKAGGGSINDAYLAGLCGALRRYHDALGVPISTLPMAVPVSLRADADTAGGNRFTGVNLAAPMGTVDPVSRMKKIRAQMTQRRDEPAMNIIGSIAPVLSVLADSCAGGDHRLGGRLRRAGQQCPGLPGRHLHRRRKSLAAVRHWPAARRGDDGGADFPGRLVHHHRALRQGVGAETRRCSPSACWRVSTRSSRWPVIRRRRRCPLRSLNRRIRRLDRCPAHERRRRPRDASKPAGICGCPARSPRSWPVLPGPQIGAFFDLDGTLVAGFTAVILTQERLRRRDMGVGELLSMVQAGLNHTLGRIEFEDLIGKASSALAGRLIDDLEEIGERLFVQRIESRIYPEMRELVRAHVARGHTVVLSSSALTIQVNPVARFLGIANTLTNKFETNEDGLLTGGVVEADLVGAGQSRRGTEVCGRERHRPQRQLLLRRR